MSSRPYRSTARRGRAWSRSVMSASTPNAVPPAREQLGAEEPRVDDRRVDPEGGGVGRERLHPAVDGELQGGVGGPAFVGGEPGGRGDRQLARAGEPVLAD